MQNNFHFCTSKSTPTKLSLQFCESSPNLLPNCTTITRMFLTIFFITAVIATALKIYLMLVKGVAKSHTCLIGKTVLITGGNRGIGYETALGLAARGCRLIIADRDDCEETKKRIIEETNNTNVITIRFDLTSFASIRKLAEDINKTEARLDILINNAGVGYTDQKYTIDNNIAIMQINHFGGFLLTHLLMDSLKKGKNAKIIFISSILSFTNNLTEKNLNKPQKWKIFGYGNTKLCNAITTRVLAKKLEKFGIKVHCLHPGTTKTSIYNFKEKTLVNKLLHILGEAVIVNIFAKTQEEGAQTTLHVALNKNCVSGAFYENCTQRSFPKKALDEEFCRKIFEKSEHLVQLQPNERIR